MKSLNETQDTILTDNNILDQDAKYWCVFAKANRTNIIQEAYMDHMSDTPSPSSLDSIIKDMSTSRISKEAAYIAKGIKEEDAILATNIIIDKLKKNGENSAAAMAMEMGDCISNIEGNHATQAGSELVTIAQGLDKTMFSRALDVLKNRLQDASNWFWLGTSDIDALDNMSNVEKLKRLISYGGVHAIELIVAVYLLYKTRNYTIPRINLLWKTLTKGKALAKCKFSDTNGEDYILMFDSKKMAWTLRYNRIFKHFTADNNDMTPSPASLKSFFETKFFNKFKDRCVEIIEPMLNATEGSLEAELSKSDKKMLNQLVASKEKLSSTMFAGKYASFT